MGESDTRWISAVPIAHRGLHNSERPENSIPAFEAAAAAGYGIELDIHLTSDRQLVVIHDDDTERLTGTRLTVTQSSVSQLKALNLRVEGVTIPLLQEVLDTIDGRVPVLVEVKTGSDAATLGPVLVNLLGRYDGKIAVQSFDPRIISWLRSNHPDLIRGQLSGSFSKESMSIVRKFLLRSMVLNIIARPDFLALDIDSVPSLPARFWTRVLRVPLILWTVRTPAQQKAAEHYGANIIFEGFEPTVR